MECGIAKINYCDIPQILKIDRTLIFNPKSIYYAFFNKCNPISILGIRTMKNGIKIQSNYTIPEYRGQGYFSALLTHIMRKYTETLYADCTDKSVNIYIKNGFEEYDYKRFKNFNIHYVKLKRR
jgi:GNAT superfamily N-acetyltransferase